MNYFILKRGTAAGERTLWHDLGTVDAGYPEAALQQIGEQHGEGEYMVMGSYSPERYTVTASKEYDVKRIEQEQEPEPTLAEMVERAA